MSSIGLCSLLLMPFQQMPQLLRQAMGDVLENNVGLLKHIIKGLCKFYLYLKNNMMNPNFTLFTHFYLFIYLYIHLFIYLFLSNEFQLHQNPTKKMANQKEKVMEMTMKMNKKKKKKKMMD